MKSFSYVAQDARSRQVKGIMNAENEQEFLQKAKEKGDPQADTLIDKYK